MRSRPVVSFVQGNLFSNFGFITDTTNKLIGDVLSMPEAEVTFYQNCFSLQQSDEIFNILYDEINWRQDTMKLYGKDIALPRKTAWYGDQDKSYKFSGIQLNPEPWTPTLLQVKKRIEDVAGVQFNSVLLNLYRHGNDGISWHSDKEPELGKNPTIGSVSFGETRRFMFRYRKDKDLKTEIELTHGSFLLMAGETQHFWQHQIPKTSKHVQPRINLTFRMIIN